MVVDGNNFFFDGRNVPVDGEKLNIFGGENVDIDGENRGIHAVGVGIEV
eukprot:CAMPEP_0194317318 /NCGR_PEP_ID=MMETSP0171-20130528/14060_1 /TAXON_ID=218684 /ORGANISM="Corethron pennatum, Strain L29A3" /LENGTH=48 /DNA_ID= /DNA_START= /DNA_END= /DNA_ORIENTATION=